MRYGISTKNEIEKRERREKKMIKTFSIESESWWADAFEEDYEEQITLELYKDKKLKGVVAEATATWRDGKCVLEFHEDAFILFRHFKDFLEELSLCSKMEPEPFCGLLIKHGFVDVTKRERGK